MLFIFTENINGKFSSTFTLESLYLGFVHFLDMEVLDFHEAYFFIMAGVMREILGIETFSVRKCSTLIEEFDDVKSLSQINVILRCLVNPFWLFLTNRSSGQPP